MDNVLKVWRICLLGLKKLVISPRMYVCAALIVVFINQAVSPITSFASSVNVTPWLLPFITSDNYMIIIIFACAVILFCDAPFLDEQQPYIIIRSNKIVWAISQIAYIIITCFLFTLFVFIAICINLVNLIFQVTGER